MVSSRRTAWRVLGAAGRGYGPAARRPVNAEAAPGMAASERLHGGQHGSPPCSWPSLPARRRRWLARRRWRLAPWLRRLARRRRLVARRRRWLPAIARTWLERLTDIHVAHQCFDSL